MINGLVYLKMYLAARLNSFLRDERGEVNIVATVVLIGIAVVLAVVFRGAISNLIKTLLNTISGQATNAVAGE